MSSYKFLIYRNENGIATIALNRPDVYNALNDEITFELQDALKAVAKDDAVRVVVLTGEGKAFCSGQDLKASAGTKRSFIDSLHKRYNPIIRAIRNLPKPVICRLNGVAAGAGCSLALACDVIIASEEATLIEVFINIGLVPDSGSSYFLPRLVGIAKAFELCSIGSKVKAGDAAKMGLINKAVPAEQLDAVVVEYTSYYAKAPTKAIGLIKKMLNRSATASLDEMLEYEAYCQEIAGNSDDYKEGVAAFLEKRKPGFMTATEIDNFALERGHIIEWPLTAEDQAAIDRLRAIDAAAFDRVYVDETIRAHERAEALLRSQSAGTGQAAVIARNTLPGVQQHLAMARDLQLRL